MSEFRSEKSEMSSSAFVQMALRSEVAPPALGSVKTRITHAARKLGFKTSRTKDLWYADPRVSIDADEMSRVEEISGLTYARQEMRTNDELIAKLDALMEGDADFYGAFRAALRSVVGLPDRTGDQK